MDTPTDKQSENSAVPSKKNGKKATVIINPPEKGPLTNVNELFKSALQKHTVAVDPKISIVLEAKAARAGFDRDVIERVFVRGYKNLPLNTELTREQYAMNRVNSFLSGGAAMQEDADLLPIVERLGLKGSGGAMRPHIRREKNPYNNKVTFHVVDAKGIVKHSTTDEFEARKHLAQKYSSYMGEARAWGLAGIEQSYKKITGKTMGQRAKEVEDLHAKIAATAKENEKMWAEREARKKQQNEMFEAAVKRLKGKDPCWKNYKMVGLKPNGDPNCVGPVKEYGDPEVMYKKAAATANAKLQAMKAMDKTAEYEKQRVAKASLMKKEEKGVEIDPMKRLIGTKELVKVYRDATPGQEQADIAEMKTPAWSRKEGKNPEGGLNRKGIASYRAQNPGSKLSMAVTTKPSKLKKDSKAYNRRKSFCARMSGVEGPMKKPNGEPTRKALALRKWNC